MRVRESDQTFSTDPVGHQWPPTSGSTVYLNRSSSVQSALSKLGSIILATPPYLQAIFDSNLTLQIFNSRFVTDSGQGISQHS